MKTRLAALLLHLYLCHVPSLSLSLYCYPSLSCYTSFPLLCPLSLSLLLLLLLCCVLLIMCVIYLGSRAQFHPNGNCHAQSALPLPLSPPLLPLSLFALLSFLFLAASGTLAVHLHILNAFGRKIVTGERCAISALPRPAISAHQSALFPPLLPVCHSFAISFIISPC